MSDSIGRAIASLTYAIQDNPVLTAEDALQIATLIPTLHQSIAPDSVAGSDPQSAAQQDPRFAIALASSAEAAAHEALRTQTLATHLVESTAAHTLTSDELEAVRSGTIDFTREAHRSGQRPGFRNSTDLLASWLRLENFEAKRRIASAHHVFAQFDYQHQQFPAQFPLMAQRFQDASRPAR